LFKNKHCTVDIRHIISYRRSPLARAVSSNGITSRIICNALLLYAIH